MIFIHLLYIPYLTTHQTYPIKIYLNNIVQGYLFLEYSLS